ncbi:MAG: tRNA (adenosine(37)-N6)-dimethylallyltransferase MiaA, partial [Desulfovibrionaceae bacterium]|nr:tRNA (adenosine(37)-N6)-dimethylallyltransferase MiaA [Desulfovibrionaceae bacterium]
LGLAELTPRLARRIEAMLAAGAAQETARAFAACPDPLAPGFSGIGCPELLAHLRGEASIEQTRALWLKNTRAYAKRQITWFKREEGVAWFAPGEAEKLAAHVVRALGGMRKE